MHIAMHCIVVHACSSIYAVFVDTCTLVHTDTHTVSELAQDGEYAGNDAIVAFSRCYFMHVVIHQLNAPRWEVHAPRSTAAAALNLKTLHIAYLNGEHYCSIQPLIRAAESASATPLLPQLSIGCGKGEEKAHTPGQRATHTSKVSSTS